MTLSDDKAVTTRVRDRAIAVLELLAQNAPGLLLVDIADTLGIPRSATHRVLADLKAAGYVRQEGEGERYLLTAKLVSVASTYLANAGVTDLVQPVLDRLAASTGELVRLATVSGDGLLWVARSQGSRQALRYDPSDGLAICLSTTSIGHAWLACFPDEDALQLIARQGVPRSGYGPRAPRSVGEVMTYVRRARTRGYATVTEANEAGTSAVSTAVLPRGARAPIAMVNVAGPTVRLSKDRMESIAPPLIAAAGELVEICVASPLFRAGGVPVRRPDLLAAV